MNGVPKTTTKMTFLGLVGPLYLYLLQQELKLFQADRRQK